MDIWAKYDIEREALCGDLAGLDPGQWETQSLCTEWKVRHVVAHLVTGSDVKPLSAFGGLLRSGMNFNRYIARDAIAAGAAPPEELLAELRETVGRRKTPPMAKPVNMLADTVCHSADIRRPLGIKRSAPEDTVVEVAESLKGVGFPVGASKRIAGLRLTATDVAWSTGNGPSVEGPAESLILAMAGRPAGLDDCTGDGVAVLKSRM
jgi:uncharacterized protein (TIGR03083 family)